MKNKSISIYLTMGYPHLETALHLVPRLEAAGVDFLELGMPFSDPLADGETIQKSSARALKNGMNLDIYFEQVQTLRKTVKIPFIFMGYYNSVMAYGVDRFLHQCKTLGINGLIIPDLPLEEYELKFEPVLGKLDFHFLITPQTNENRIVKVASLQKGFIYAISSNNITGVNLSFDNQLNDYLYKLKKMNLKNEICVGFGLKSKAKIDRVHQYGFGAIIGSHFLKLLAEGEDKAMEFIKNIK